MFKLDDNLLIELGLGSLPPAEKNRMLSHIYETLEMRVGMKLAQKMTNEQLDEFEAFIDRNDEGGALKWLEGNFPNYKQVVADELEALKAEIKAAAPQIVMASQQAAAAAPQVAQTQSAQPTAVPQQSMQQPGVFNPPMPQQQPQQFQAPQTPVAPAQPQYQPPLQPQYPQPSMPPQAQQYQQPPQAPPATQ